MVREAEEFYKLLEEGYVPYFCRRVKRWYLRRGRVRVLVDRCLESCRRA